MSQVYHSNAKLNQHSREIIQNSELTNVELAQRFSVNEKTIAKWKSRDFTEDKSSRPKTIHYALNPIEQKLIELVRIATWMNLDDLVDTVSTVIPDANRSNVYRTLKSLGISSIPEEKKAEAKKFKEYEPGYLHIDVTYMPKLEGTKYYLFVAIDRATRVMYYKVYENKTAENAVLFLQECKEFFPFYITHILTDNGLEFTDKYARGKNKVSGNHQFDKECAKDDIDHRLTAPNTPKTNGMVERVNGTIKDRTIKVETYENVRELIFDLSKFLIFYLFIRRHSSLRRELGANVRTPFDAMQSWFKVKPELFKISPDEFRAYALDKLEQCCET
ncbi:Mobile element protein [hydrothermal vent metagenome]|uniref:Mobile element protein n=1 Tax=hydrothermal vent metagenome TaxID=652676 RepID=A0A1W1CCH3_9ZZZZ